MKTPKQWAQHSANNAALAAMDNIIADLQRKLTYAQRQRECFLNSQTVPQKLKELALLLHDMSVNNHPRHDQIARAMVELTRADTLPDDHDPLS